MEDPPPDATDDEEEVEAAVVGISVMEGYCALIRRALSTPPSCAPGLVPVMLVLP